MKRSLIKMLVVIVSVTMVGLITKPAITNAGTEKKLWSEEEQFYQGKATGISIITNASGETLGYSKDSGVNILTNDGLAFKDLNKNSKLDKYEDWRLDVDTRAKDLASQMSIDEIAGLMLYSSHQSVNSSELTASQKEFFEKDNLRHVLITSVKDPETAAKWNNNAQALSEKLGLGIPSNTSSDPRHGTDASAEYNEGAGGKISMWPSSLGMAATFDPEIVGEFGKIASKEYRALGIATALSPQVDLATDPRWSRVSGTFGESSKLSAQMGREYIDGFQTSEGSAEINSGWGYESVNAMVKHWPGGGTGEGGRDAHYGYGKYAVYPGDNMQEHLIPFTQGAFALKGGTEKASAVMPYYTISWNQDPTGGNVGNAYSNYMIKDLLREVYKYDGVVCTDWGITGDEIDMTQFGGGTCWGVENLSVAERFYMLVQAGVDQFGGVNKSGGIIDGYKLGVKDKGEEFMRTRFEQSAVRLLRNIFNAGLFENAYLDVEKSVETVGNSAYMETGYNAQLKSVTMIKNKNDILPLYKENDTDKKSVYIPKKYIPGATDWWGNPTEAKWIDAVNMELANKYFNVTDKPEEADLALVFVDNPSPGKGYSKEDKEAGGNGYLPLTLQYGEYTAKDARDPSIAGDYREIDVLNRSYKDKTVTAANVKDLDVIIDTKKAMGDKPVIVNINMQNPMVFSEFENEVDGILVGFDVQDQALLDILSGKVEPSGLLPIQMPKDMKNVEEQSEDVAFDMKCHVDSEGNTYDFAFGLNWSGVINDERVEQYKPVEEEIIVGKVKKLDGAATGATVKLTWEEPTSVVGLKEYVVYKDGKEFKKVPAGSTKIEVDGLKANTIYGFKVTAKFKNGEESKPVSKNIRTKKS